MFFPYNLTHPVHLPTNFYLGIRLLRKRIIDDSLRYVETIDDGKTNANGSVDTEMATISVLPRWRRGVQVEISFAVFILYLETPRKYVYRVSFTLSVPLYLYLYISIVF